MSTSVGIEAPSNQILTPVDIRGDTPYIDHYQSLQVLVAGMRDQHN
jgi:hypothetical protein